MITRSTKGDDMIDASNESTDVLIRKRRYSSTLKKWSAWQVEYRRPPNNNHQPFVLSLKLGGTVRVYPNLLPLSIQKEMAEELKNHATYFRQYRIQGTNEPRAHFLLHERAPGHAIDDESNKSPGYKYGHITMKARPLHLLPHLQKFSVWLKDNDQEEELIVTVLITSPPKPRRVIFKRMPDAEKRKKLRNGRNRKTEPNYAEKRARLQDGDEEFELWLSAGDAYSMDGEMQKSYVHGVPKDDCLGNDDADRIAIVYRCGAYAEYTKDSGKCVSDLLPRPIVQRSFGQMDGLTEGESYGRTDIHEMGAHRSPQGGVSGSKEEGCDAIIVSGARKDGFGDDFFDELIYAADTRVGAGGILTSMERDIPIRVFRSSRLDNKYAAHPNGKNESAQYRYDGLYRLVGVSFDDGSGVEREETPACLSPLITGRLYKFRLARIEVGKDAVSNRKSTNEMLEDTIEPARKLICAKALLSLSMGGKHRGKKRKAYQAHSFGLDLLLTASLQLATPSLSLSVSALPIKKRNVLVLPVSALPIKKRNVLVLPVSALLIKKRYALVLPVSALPIKKRKVLVKPEQLQSVQTTKWNLTF